ncbi:unnamed protein product [Schistosoma curassoni]|uniref:Reverse transcriptase domain-containing protein n=1 Tax=Schistosoma curassoni TaxID=6186 RepID=A0A183JYE0_9TREM|nr:unnamed protein product [Schistosoma curassoni]
MFPSCKYAALALPIRAFTPASDPTCSSMMLPKYVKVFTSSKSSPSIVIRLLHAVLYRRILLFPWCILRPTTAEAAATLVIFSCICYCVFDRRAFHNLLNGEGTTMESNWKEIKEAITSTCHEVLRHKKHHHKEWITVDTLDKIQERRNKKAAINTSRTRTEKAKAQAEYTEVNKQVKRSIRTDKRKYVEDLATTAEKAAREGNMRQLYDTTKKKLSGNRRKPERPVGRTLRRTLESTAPLNPPNIEAAPTDLPINVSPPTIREIIMAIRQIKSGKAPRPDNIPAEALKADVAATARILHILFNKIWDEEQVPKDWKEGLLIKIPKKGDLSKCDNYRGITLL